MKIILIGLEGATAAGLFEDETLENVRRLMEFGCYGLLADAPARFPWLSLAAGRPLNGVDETAVMAWDVTGEGRAVTINLPPSGSETMAAVFAEAIDQLQADDWTFCQLIAPAADDADQLDAAILAILTLLDEETAVAIVGQDHSGVGCFILAAINNPFAGTIEGASWYDIAPTLLELAGYETPPPMSGASLMAGQVQGTVANVNLNQDEEALLRERLSGLGYIG